MAAKEMIRLSHRPRAGYLPRGERYDPDLTEVVLEGASSPVRSARITATILPLAANLPLTTNSIPAADPAHPPSHELPNVVTELICSRPNTPLPAYDDTPLPAYESSEPRSLRPSRRAPGPPTAPAASNALRSPPFRPVRSTTDAIIFRPLPPPPAGVPAPPPPPPPPPAPSPASSSHAPPLLQRRSHVRRLPLPRPLS
ncbi:unnamed protein product [Peniophora sp. CBMAI 1063]|nr:unnamed protein product [Peniophora sp. CBMAI 1063]